MDIKPLKIEVAAALRKFNGNQAALARFLGIGRCSVNEWVRTGRKHLPELRAYQFVEAFGPPKKKSQRAA